MIYCNCCVILLQLHGFAYTLQGNKNHMRGCHCIREVADVSDLQRPDLITSTKLRKYMATVAQVLIID